MCHRERFSFRFLVIAGFIFSFSWAAAPAEAGPIVAEYLPASRGQSNGIIDNVGNAQTFVPSISERLESVGLIIDRRGAPLSNLMLEVRTVASGDLPSSTVLGTASLTPAEVPVFLGLEGFSSPPEDVLTFFDFSSQGIDLVAGIKYALVLLAPGSDDPATPSTSDGYGWFVGPPSPTNAGNFSETNDAGASFNVFPFNFDGSFRVTVVPEPATGALLLGAAGWMLGRRRASRTT